MRLYPYASGHNHTVPLLQHDWLQMPVRGSTKPLLSATTVPHYGCSTVGRGVPCRAASGGASGAAAPVVTSSPAQTNPRQQQQIDIDDFATDKRPIILFDGVCNL